MAPCFTGDVQTDRLQRRDLVRMPNGSHWRVEYVNECRAHIRAVNGRRVEIADRAFTAQGSTLDISPNSAIEIVKRDARVKR